ncbi:MBL fold metallo-hydrolase, partial [Candidatus Peregrinibacteria bacterium]|nr:MBL fold metallo-hydrolase [Candidatus Peregrinibacteria bacterium]
MIILSRKIKKSVISVLIVLYSVFILLLLQLPDDKFHIFFLDVGQGDSIFIKTPQNHQILIDGGPKNIVIERLGEIMPFFDKSLDFLVLTHPHADHVDGLVEVLKRYKVENVLLTGVYSEYSAYFEFLDIVYDKKINVFFAEANNDFLFSNVLIDVIY